MSALFLSMSLKVIILSHKIYPIGVQNFESLRKDLHLDLNAKKFDTPEDLIHLIDRQLLVFEQEYGSVSSDVTIGPFSLPYPERPPIWLNS